MLDGRWSESHPRRCRALVHAVERVLVDVAAQHAPRRWSAARLQRTGTAVGGRGLIEHGAVLAMKLFAVERLACRALEAVALRPVYEEATVEQSAVALVVDAAVGGHMRNQPGGLATPCLFAVGVA